MKEIGIRVGAAILMGVIAGAITIANDWPPWIPSIVALTTYYTLLFVMSTKER